MRAFVLPFLLAVVAATPSHAQTDWKPVGQALGKEGTVMGGGVYRVGLPRTDLNVTLDGVKLEPAFALGSWVAFVETGSDTMVMGDLVLTSDEINPVASKLQSAGIDITALHNHLLRAEPATMYMHIEGHGDPVKLATAVHDGLALSKTPFTAAPPAQPSLSFDQAAMESAVGYKGMAAGQVLQFSIPRARTIHDGGMEVPPAMGTAIGVNFQGAGSGKAATTGDFVLTASEVNPVLKALRANGIEVTALHNHMLQDEPRLFFMHFWGNDDPQKLAKGIRAALDLVDVAKPAP